MAIVASQDPKVEEASPDNVKESDSEPSCDNFGEQDLVKRFEAAMD